jgi:predicted PurR-regulated permease PerM
MAGRNGSGRLEGDGLLPREALAEPPRESMGDFARRVVVATLVILLFVTLAAVCWKGIGILLQAFAGVLFAIFLTALSNWLSRVTRLSYHLSLVVVVLGLLLVTGGLGWLLASRLSTQISELWQKLPESLQQLHDYLAQFTWGRTLLQQIPKSPEKTVDVGDFSRMTGLISGVASFVVAVIVILFVGIFGAAEPALYRSGLLHLVPPAHRPRTAEAVDAVVFNLRWWLVGQFFLMVIIGVTTTVCLWAMGIPLALTLGLIAGFLEIVPYLGPWLSAVPALLMALLVSPWHVLAVGGLYIGLHILEGYVLLPLVQRRSVLLPPALTLVSQVLLGGLLGLMGLFVAAPLTVACVVLMKMLYVEDTLGDQGVNVPGEPGNEAKPVATRH